MFSLLVIVYFRKLNSVVSFYAAEFIFRFEVFHQNYHNSLCKTFIVSMHVGATELHQDLGLIDFTTYCIQGKYKNIFRIINIHWNVVKSYFIIKKLNGILEGIQHQYINRLTRQRILPNACQWIVCRDPIFPRSFSSNPGLFP